MDHTLPLHCLKDGLVGNKKGKVDEGAEVKEVDHTLPRHCLKDGLVGNEEGEANEVVKVEEVPTSEERLEHRLGWHHR